MFKVFALLLVLNGLSCQAYKDIFGCTWVKEDHFCDRKLIKFLLYTRYNGSSIEVNATSISASTFERNVTKLIIHGYHSSPYDSFIVNMRDRYLKQGVQVLLVDWRPISPKPCYLSAVHDLGFVGKCVANLIKSIRKVSPSNIPHVIGLSLGGEAIGSVAHFLAPYKLPRATGLDPAGPGFYVLEFNRRLNPACAHFVDVVHTGAIFEGIALPVGHADFYVNGGFIQPGCGIRFNCYHQRAFWIYGESIDTSRGFYGYHCGEWLSGLLWLPFCHSGTPVLMGDHVDTKTRGVFYVKTADKSPYALGKYF